MYSVNLKLGERIAVLRSRMGMTQAQLAEAAGLRQRTHVAKIESGDIAMPDDSTLGGIARALRITVDELLSDNGPSRGGDVIRNGGGIGRSGPSKLGGFELIDFYAGMVSVPLTAEVALGEPMDHSVEGETVLVPADLAPDIGQHEYLIRGRGDSMIDFGIEDGDYVVVEARPGGVAATGELVIAWYEPADRAIPGGITLKRWIRRGGRKILQGSTEKDTFELREGDIFELKGIVRRAIKVKKFPKISG